MTTGSPADAPGFHNPDIISPHLDELHSQGVELMDHHVYRYCAPTRSSFLSGRLCAPRPACASRPAGPRPAPPALRGPQPTCSHTHAGRGALGRRPYKLAATRKNFNPATVKDGLHLSYKTIGDKLQSAGYSVRPHHFAALRHKTAQLTAATTLARRPTNSASGTSAIRPCPPSPTSSRPLRLRRC